jgi:polysaccharide biosynthesis transport protein
MAVTTMTPRDKLQRIVDLGRKTRRYWWLVVIFAVGGGALSLAFALIRPKNYQSYSVLFYQERIRSSLLSNREEVVQRNIGDRYRELLLARGQLAQIINDPQLNPFPDEDDTELAIDKLREKIRFESRGANAFRITYSDTNPDRAKTVTDKLTKMLQDKDEFLRKDQARVTVAFALKQKEEATLELAKQETALAQFLAKHPEFAQESAQMVGQGGMAGEGAAIRGVQNQKSMAKNENARLYALERQRQRIQARLDAPPDAPPIRIPAPQTPEKIAAEAEVAQARNEVAAANRELESALGKYTEQHPSAVRAKARVAEAQAKLKRAQASVPSDVETTIAPATEADRTKLKQELARLESQINEEQKRGSKAPAAVDAATNWVVQLETDHAKLRRAVTEGRERVEALSDSVFRAELDANQKLADTGAVLSVVDPAFRPVKPSGPGKTLILLAGVALFLALGTGLALGMAVIDDRVYRRSDLEELGISVLAVIPPAQARALAKKQQKKRKAARQ